MHISEWLLGLFDNFNLIRLFLSLSLSSSTFCEGSVDIRVDEMAVWIASEKKGVRQKCSEWTFLWLLWNSSYLSAGFFGS